MTSRLSSKSGSPTRFGEEIVLGSRHRIQTEGLSQSQLAALSSAASELREQGQELERVISYAERLRAELDTKTQLLIDKDAQIAELRAKEADDVAAFKESQRQSCNSLELKVAQINAQLRASEDQAQSLKMELQRVSQRNTMLQLKVDELQDTLRRGGSDVSQLQASHSETLRSLKVRVEELQRQCSTAESRAAALADQLGDKEAALRDATQRAEQAERDEERAAQDLRFFKSTTLAEMEKQQQALVDANEGARAATAELQAAKGEIIALEARLASAESAGQEQAIQLSRAQDDAQRWKEEVELLRKGQGELHVELRKLEVVNQQRDSQVADLRQLLQEGARESDLTQRQVQVAADRLRRTNDGVSSLLRPDAQTPRGEVPVTPRVDHTAPGDLEGEVERAERHWQQLHAAVQAQRWEKQTADLAREKERQAAAQLQQDLERRLNIAERHAGRLQAALDVQRAEGLSRGHLAQDERAAWSSIALSVEAARQAVLRERLGTLGHQEGWYRHAVENWQVAARTLLRTAMEQHVVAHASIARYEGLSAQMDGAPHSASFRLLGPGSVSGSIRSR